MSTTGQQWMRVMRAMQRELVRRNKCGQWIPGEPTLCVRYAGHREAGTACGRRKQEAA